MWCERANPPRLPADAHEREAPVLERDENVACSHLGDRVERHEEVVVVLELLAHELLGLALIGRDEKRAGLDREAERLALRVEDHADVAPREIANRVGVERRRDLARQRSREDDEVGAAREVVELLDERLELDRADLGAPLVDLRVSARRRIDDRRRRPRLGRDPDEVVEDRLGGELLDDPRPGAAAREPGGDHRHVEDLQRASDVDALAAREREHLARAVAEADLEHRHRQRPVERGIRRHRDDHVIIPQRFEAVWVAYHVAFAKKPASATDSAATRLDDATSVLPS